MFLHCKFQPKDKSYLYNISESGAEPLKDGSAASISNPNAAAFSLRRYVATLAKFCQCRYFTHVIRQPFGAIPSSSDMFCMLDGVLRQRLSHLRS